MELELSKTDVEKILSCMDTEQIEQKLDGNYSYWNVSCEASHPFKLRKKEKKR